jgi:predicted house-cleaning noncanonical NTP pyrophosphatase (MazG superfamily)
MNKTLRDKLLDIIGRSDPGGYLSTSEENSLTDELEQLIAQEVAAARIDELKHITVTESITWWGEKSKDRDIAMTIEERIEELSKGVTKDE